MKYFITCTETVVSKFIVEAKDKEQLEEWLEVHGADAVSECEDQAVVDREYNKDIVIHGTPDYSANKGSSKLTPADINALCNNPAYR